MTDVDFIEWRYRGNKLVAVGVMEVTRVDIGKEVGQGYLQSILSRYKQRDMQAEAALNVAQALGTKAYIVLFRADCREFWVYNLSDGRGWCHFSTDQMEAFLRSL